MNYLFSVIIGYLLGSFPTAYLILKQTKGINITENGTGNVGAMNSFEVSGSKLTGILVFIIDALKGLLSVYLVLLLLPINFGYPAVALAFAVLAHCFNPWLQFKGGRGLATAFGGLMLIFPIMIPVWLIIWLFIYLTKKDIILANAAALILTFIMILGSSGIAFKYTFPRADGVPTMIMFTIALLFPVFIKHIEPLKDTVRNNNPFRMRKNDE